MQIHLKINLIHLQKYKALPVCIIRHEMRFREQLFLFYVIGGILNYKREIIIRHIK